MQADIRRVPAIATLLPLKSLNELRDVVGDDRIRTFIEEEALCRSLATSTFDALVLDTALLTGSGSEGLKRTLEEAKTPTIVYADTAAGPPMDRLVDLLNAGVCQVVPHRIEESPRVLELAVRALPAQSHGVRLLARLKSHIERLTPPLKSSLVALFASTHVSNTKARGTAIGVTRRSVDRLLARGGLMPAAWFINAARLLRLISSVDAGSSFRRSLGPETYMSRQSFERQVRRLTGLTARDVELQVTRDGRIVVDLLAERSLLHYRQPL